VLWGDVGLLGEVFDGKLLKFLACVYVEKAEAFEFALVLADGLPGCFQPVC